MSELVCIECPRGCTMKVECSDGQIAVSGNFCKRGESFARAEMTEPMRTICTTVRTTSSRSPVLPVRVSGEIPKNRIFDVMKEINSVVVKEKVKRGEAVIKNVLGLGVDIIATGTLTEE